MIEGIGPDLISDITTNVIRGPLVHYTQDQAAEHGIAVETVYVGPMWDPEAEDWQQLHVQVPRPARPLVLVPKALVRTRMDYDEYYSDYLIPFLIDAEIEAGSSLVRVLKDGRQRVDIKDIKEKYGTGKAAIERITREHPQLLDKYREAKARVHPPLNHLALAQVTNSPEPDWDALLARVTRVRVGNAGASAFHNAVEALLSALLYPALNMPTRRWRSTMGASGSTSCMRTAPGADSSTGSRATTVRHVCLWNAKTTKAIPQTRSSTSWPVDSHHIAASSACSSPATSRTRISSSDVVATQRLTTVGTSSRSMTTI